MNTDKPIALEKDATGKLMDICRTAKNPYVRQILLGATVDLSDDEFYETHIAGFEKKFRRNPSHRLNMIKRIVNLAFLYIISKYTSIDMDITSNCEARINNVIGNLYNAYNASDDVVRYVILNVALGLDASDKFKEKFDLIAGRDEFYKGTNEYINIFNHIQNMRNAAFKSGSLDTKTPEWLYKFMFKVSFICDLDIVPCEVLADPESTIIPCAFESCGKRYSSKYALATDRTDGYDRFVMLRSIDETVKPDGKKQLRLNYTDIGSYDTGENVAVTVVNEGGQDDAGRVVKTKSLGVFYSYITGDLLRKRHRMSFCNGLSSYKYYGELVASIVDAFEKIEILPDKRHVVVEKYILPVIKNNFNICKEDCICMGTGCKHIGMRPCNKDRYIDLEKDLNADCVSNMDIVSILTILFSVVGCKEILPQIFDRYDNDAQALDVLFDTVNSQLEKRFSEFRSERVKSLRDEFYKKSIDYLSLNIDESNFNDPTVALPLKPFRIRAYTDALVTVLENLDRDGADGKAVNPIGNVYSISNKIDLISGIKNIKDVRTTLRTTLKVILAYYSGLAACRQQQLTYEVKAEQASMLCRSDIDECEKNIMEAFRSGVAAKLKDLGDDSSFYELFKALKDDNKLLRENISIMLGREMVNVRALEKYIRLDDEAGKCYIQSVAGGEIYECDLDDEAQCELDEYKNVFVNRVVELLRFFNGEGADGARCACYPQVLTHTSSRVNVDNTTISAFTSCESERHNNKKEYNVITYFKYDIGKRYFYVAPKKYEKTRWITYPILVRCSEFYDMVFGGK